jgi:hypothetical protein
MQLAVSSILVSPATNVLRQLFAFVVVAEWLAAWQMILLFQFLQRLYKREC